MQSAATNIAQGSNQFGNVHSQNSQILQGNFYGLTINSKAAARPNYVGHYSQTSLRPVASYVRRPALHRQLKEQLHDTVDGQQQDSLILVVSGLGGVGKSQLVMNYLQENRSDYSPSFWIEASRKESIDRDFLQIYRLLIGGQTTAESALPKIEDVIQEVKGWFNGRDGRWLLVFDGADGIGDEVEDDSWLDLAKYLPDAPGTHIIITTRNSSARDITAAQPIEVGKLEIPEAVDLFFKCAGLKDRSQESEVKKIVEELGCLALAVNLAGYYTSKTPRLGRDLKKYLPEYRQRRKELLGEKPRMLIQKYRESVLTTWEASFSAVERRSAVAARLLILLAFLNYDDIFTDLFCSDTDSDERRTVDITSSTSTWQSIISPDDAINLYTIEECLGILQEYSLIQWREDQQSYTMHKLVHAWGSDRLNAEEQRRFSRAALKLLAGATSVRQADLEYRTRLVL